MREDLSEEEETGGRKMTGRSSVHRASTERSAGASSMNSITALINNFLEFIKTRCEIVYVEYDEYHKLLKDLVHQSQKDSRLKMRLNEIFQRGREDLCG